MIEKGLLKVLVCPKDNTPLTMADSRLIARLNRAIAAGQIVNCVGQPVRQPLMGGLVGQTRAILYPIVDDIPVLLADEAIALAQMG
jgi:uncharacterized protein